MLQVERFFQQSRMLLRHCCRFFGNNVEQNFVFLTRSRNKWNIRFDSTSLKGRNFTINSFDILWQFLATKSKVASTLLLVWRELYSHYNGQPVLADTCTIVKNWRILLEQHFTARRPLLATISALGLGRRAKSFPQRCYYTLRPYSVSHILEPL